MSYKLVRKNLEKLFINNKTLLLAYDQGLEHGPSDFNEKNVDPKFIIDLAEEHFNGIILHHGIAEKYYDKKKNKVPLIIKLNGKTRLLKLDPNSKQLCSVKRAYELGASAVGYTIYDGSINEPEMFHNFGKIVEEAHNIGLPVIAWMYPRGRFVKDELDSELINYSVRIALELGADVVKIKFNNDYDNMPWLLKLAGKTKVLIAGGSKQNEIHFLKEAYKLINLGINGFAVGRNIWQSKKPHSLSAALRKIVIENKSIEEAIKFLT